MLFQRHMEMFLNLILKFMLISMVIYCLFQKAKLITKQLLPKKFFLHVHRLVREKAHLHHSHITGKILDYAHDFCNLAYVEKCTPEIPFVVHNYFGFDLFYYMKAYIASACCPKQLDIGGTN